jgi:hypothetical protein
MSLHLRHLFTDLLSLGIDGKGDDRRKDLLIFGSIWLMTRVSLILASLASIGGHVGNHHHDWRFTLESLNDSNTVAWPHKHVH